jgi:hypothetical protein
LAFEEILMARIFAALICLAFLEGASPCQEKPKPSILAEDLAALEGQWVKVNPPKGEEITLTFRGNNKSFLMRYSIKTPKQQTAGYLSLEFNLVKKDDKRFIVFPDVKTQGVTYQFDAQKLMLDGNCEGVILTGQWKMADKKEDKK